MRKNINGFQRVIVTALAAAAAFGLTACGADTADAGQAADTTVETAALDDTANEADTASDETGADAEGSSEVKKVIAAHTNYYKPYDFEDENGNSDGYEVAVLKAVDELLPQYEFEFVPTTDDDLLIGVESGKYDVGTKGVWWTQARSETYVFPKNYIGASIIGITMRAEDKDKYTDLEAFAKEGGKLVPIAPQNAQYNIVQNFNASHPDTPIDLLESDAFQVADAYQWVLEGRYDAYFDIRTSFEANVVSEDGEYHELADQLSYAPYEGIPTWPLFNINNQELADAYDEAFEQLKADGTIAELSQKYFGYDLFDYVPEGYQIGDDL